MIWLTHPMIAADALSLKSACPTKLPDNVSDTAWNVLIGISEQNTRTGAFALFSATSVARRSAVPPALQLCKWIMKRFVDGLMSRRLTSWKSVPGMSLLELEQAFKWVISDLGRPQSFMAFDAVLWPILGTSWIRGGLATGSFTESPTSWESEEVWFVKFFIKNKTSW